MTQISRINAEHIDNGYLDAGPYSADQWSAIFGALFTENPTAEGPLTRYRNELETSVNVADIEVDTGAGICNGRILFNFALIDFTPAAPAANPRIDVVCMALNNSALPITAGTATANTLILPNDLTDYKGLSSIPAYSVRLAILPGNENAVPVAPTLDTDIAATFMVPLTQYQLSVAGAYSNKIDLRQMCKFATERPDRTQKFFVPMVGGWNVTDGAAITRQNTNGWIFLDNKRCEGLGDFYVPDDFVSDMKAKIVVTNLYGSTGNIDCGNHAGYGACSELIALHSDVNDDFAGVATIINNCNSEMTLLNANIGDIVRLLFERYGADINDTLGEDLYVSGWIVEYISDH